MHVSAIHVHINCLQLRRNVASVVEKFTYYCLFLYLINSRIYIYWGFYYSDLSHIWRVG